MPLNDEITRLSPKDEQEFMRWVRYNNLGDVDSPYSFYDYRGYWKDVASKGLDQTQLYPDGIHFPDTYKQHGHPTFSVESKYSKGPGDGGVWVGEEYIPPIGKEAPYRRVFPSDIGSVTLGNLGRIAPVTLNDVWNRKP